MDNVVHFPASLFQYFPVVMFIAATIIFAVFTLVISHYLSAAYSSKRETGTL